MGTGSSSREPIASVLVCTRNRSKLLADACEAALQLELPSGEWELVVVDNGSTDDTLAVARSLECRHPERVRVVEEHEVGLSAARNAAVRAARGRVLAFLDDDAYPEAAWLRAIVAAFEDPDVYAVGGPVEPLLSGELPDWFRGRYLGYLSVWDRGEEREELVYNEYPRGANVAFRREAFELHGGFSTQLGRKGSSLLSGEEIELCLRIERAGGKIRYVPEARVHHVTPADRVTPEWMASRFESQGRSEAIINWRHAGWRGLGLGLRLYLRNALGAATAEPTGDDVGAVYARCQRRALWGFVREIPHAVATVRRYRGDGAAAWRPFG